jgi:hypothetical protein
MKVMTEKFDDSSGDEVMIICVEHNGNTQCSEVDDMLADESFDVEGEPSYLQVWNQVCEDIFGSWVVRSKKIQSGNWALYYPLSKKGFIANIQENHFKVTADLATLEMERIQKLIYDKYGEQLVLHMWENC